MCIRFWPAGAKNRVFRALSIKNSVNADQGRKERFVRFDRLRKSSKRWLQNEIPTSLNIPQFSNVENCVTPHTSGESGYKSRYWPGLNGLEDDSALLSCPWGQKSEPQSDRENILLDVIGAYDLLRLQGLTPEGASIRLGLRKSRDELVQELDGETARRRSVPLLATSPEQSRERV